MKYKLCDWEENGYDDSDGFLAYWDSEKNCVDSELIWTTRAAPGPRTEFEPPTLAIVEQAIVWLSDQIFKVLRSAEDRDILEPENAKQGDLLRLTAQHKSRKTGQILESGTVIRVNDCQAFGTFYAKGYNHPGRENRSIVGTVLGKPSLLIRVPLAKCRLHSEPMTDSELRSRANALARNCQFGPALSRRHAWDSNNWALTVLEKTIPAKESEVA